ncbi:MAG: putative deoxyribonuclease RhsC [Acinetobacter bereziniae]|uniref:Putative deoxyribonuclease RhsC n=1 Tax=Acinetobacter bereziniae TaxID=106648 RepID=A0A833UKQ4_ACIBZ|nr:MAG: putative deoxyribonuclease RhsC [Acinetobacter bereziniae]
MKTNKFKKVFTLLLISSFIHQSLCADTGQLPTIVVGTKVPDEFDCLGIDRPICDTYYPNWNGSGGGGPSNPVQLTTITVNATPDDSEDNDCNKTTSNPIVIANGTKIQEEVDFESQGHEMPLVFGRIYSSNRADGTKAGWTHSFDYSLVKDKNGKNARRLPDGTVQSLEKAQIALNAGQWFVTLPDGNKEVYAQNGALIIQTNAQGIGWMLVYDGTRIIEIRHTNGKTLKVDMDPNSLNINLVTDPDGNIYKYDYDSVGRLTTVNYPDGTTRSYHYGENGADGLSLTGISINGKRFTNYLYGTANKAIQSGRSDGTHTDKVSYGDTYSEVTNPSGAVTRYNYTDSTKTKMSSMERSGVINCPNASALTSYDDAGLISAKTDWNGVKTEYKRDTAGRVIEEVRGIKDGNYSAAQTIKTNWNDVTGLITKREYFTGFVSAAGSALKTENYEYYDSNNRLKSFSECDPNSCRKEEYAYTFQKSGMPETMTVTRNGKVSTYSYNVAGELFQFKNVLGHITEYISYNGFGKVGKITMPNGRIIQYIYDSRGRLIQEDKEINKDLYLSTKYEYGPLGLTKKIFPNGMEEFTNYNDNGTIASISHSADGQIISQQNYSYSNLGVLQKVEYREGDNIRYARINDQNQLGWITADKGNNGQNIAREYDGNGNIIKETNALGQAKTFSYDAMGQLLTEVQPDGSTVSYTWDSLGNLTSVTDPAGNNTTYTYNGFGEVLTQDSPATGRVNYSYDNNGNLIAETYADSDYGRNTSYRYDDLNRKTLAKGWDHTQVWRYDDCTNGIGRLCATSDGNNR